MKSSPAVIVSESNRISLPSDLEVSTVQFSKGIFDDITIHDFLIGSVLPKNPTALIIPASPGLLRTNYWGFKIAMHLRLTKELGDLRFIPLILVSNDSLEEILTDQIEKLGVLCTIPGSILVRNNDKEIGKALQRFTPITETEYGTQFLKAITINRPASTGKHSLANVWGVSRLAEATGLQQEVNEELNNRKKDLYFKYLQALADSQSKQESEINLDPLADIKAEDKQILLIDDEADNGWGAVLKPLFKNNLTCVSIKGKSFEEFYKEAEDKVKTPIWDLILLDLRLDPKEDIEGNEYKMAGQYSGAKLLTHIKQQNGGSQVIMFTASNKTWNLQKLLEMGADGYYVKESPESEQSPSFSLLTYNNFANRVNVCLGKDYLREAYALIESVKRLLNLLKGGKLVKSDIITTTFLDQGFNALYQATVQKQEFYLYSFLDFYRIIEFLGKELIEGDSRIGYTIKGKKSSGLKPIPFIQLSPVIQSEITPTKSGKDIYKFDIKSYTPPAAEERYYQYPTSSTRFSGLMLLRLGMDEIDTSAFMRLNRLRNDLTHEGSTAKVTPVDILEILRLIEQAFQKI